MHLCHEGHVCQALFQRAKQGAMSLFPSIAQRRRWIETVISIWDARSTYLLWWQNSLILFTKESGCLGPQAVHACCKSTCYRPFILQLSDMTDSRPCQLPYGYLYPSDKCVASEYEKYHCKRTQSCKERPADHEFVLVLLTWCISCLNFFTAFRVSCKVRTCLEPSNRGLVQ